ncbi:DUF6879 family protein [Salinactinospora qingdaonensis]|uniref:DUF6879 domain-containing protein n=1 Tax=Salinactinospora qingdaonensis TaxID=702744 RepID=A0ABP7FA31_9ACTN
MNDVATGEPINWDEVERLFTDFRFSAFRLETLQRYESEDEREPFRRFLGGEIERSSILKEWQAEIREGIGNGRTYSRVHVVTEPLSDYVRFECAWAYRSNVTAGENIRILAVEEGEWPDELPRLDYWLFDSRRLLVMNYTAEGALLTTELVDDPDSVAAACAWRDRAVHLSIPYHEYEARFDTYMRPR